MREYPPYSYVMTLYYGSNPLLAEKSMKSMLDQSVAPSEIVAVLDGRVDDELLKMLQRMSDCSSCPIRIVQLDRNVGPALAAQRGINESNFRLIARLDSDDIALPGRMKKQLDYIMDNPTVSSVGSLVCEIDEDLGLKQLVDLPESHDEIVEYSRRRCPCRQSSLLYDKLAVEAVGGYGDLRIAEEWDLYNRLIEGGYRCHNLQEPLVYMTVDDDYYRRRGGFETLRRISNFKWEMYKSGRMGFADFAISLGANAISCVVPNKVRSVIYRNILRKREG